MFWAALRRIALHGLVLGFLCTSSGCLSLVYAEAYYSDRKQEIHDTHASITVSGRVMDEHGKDLPGIERGYGCGIVMMCGIRETTKFSMKSEGAGDSSELIYGADWFGEQFHIHLDEVREATLVFTRDGYQTQSFHVLVPPNNKGKPVVIDDVVIVMPHDVAK